MLNPERPAIDGPWLEQSWILLVLNLHFRHVALSRASYRAFHVQHAQQSGPLRNGSRYQITRSLIESEKEVVMVIAYQG